MKSKTIGKIIGNINICVFQTPDGYNFFYLQGTDKKVLPILDCIESFLENYKKKD